uniref:Uncharacterized protein n=1 Tax=Oryza barthii TaxID=65489 RepID=A0A0D3GIJ0_9ORYZ
MGNQATGTELGRGCHMPRCQIPGPNEPGIHRISSEFWARIQRPDTRAAALLDDPRSPLAPKRRQRGGIDHLRIAVPATRAVRRKKSIEERLFEEQWKGEHTIQRNVIGKTTPPN